jgi:hypothetical protein
LRTTLTYSGNTYTGGSYFDAGIMEVQDALTSMTITINLISGYTDSLEGNISTIMTYIGDPADTSVDSTLFGYSQFLKDKWGSYSATTIYNKVVEVYNLASDANTSSGEIKSTLDDLDTYIRTYSGVDIQVGTAYNFVDDQLEVSVAYIQDGVIQNTTSATTLIKDHDGTVLKTFTDADDADNIYRYEWNSSAVGFPANGFYGAYTVIPSVVYSGNTFATVRTFNAEMPDVYGATSYSSTTTLWSDSGYSVSLSSAQIGDTIYVKVDGTAESVPDLSSLAVTVWWEDSSNTVLATSSTTGSTSSSILRFSVAVPSGTESADHIRVSASETTYGHRTSTISGLSGTITVTAKPTGGGLPPSMKKCEIRVCPERAVAGDTIEITLLVEKNIAFSKGTFEIGATDEWDSYPRTMYEVKFTNTVQDVLVSYKVPNEEGNYKINAYVNNRLMSSVPITVTKKAGLFDGLSSWQWKIPGTDIILKLG